MENLDDLISRLDRATAGSRLLDHSFYKAWAAGELTLDDLAHYSTQYWRQVEAFPGYLKTMGDRVESPAARDILTSNLEDELGQDHPGLWLDFSATVGADRDAVPTSRVEPETARCVAEFEEAVQTASLPYALGMLYGFESQTPEVAETKVAGLREHYNIDGPGVEYFRLHGVLDVRHSREMAMAISLVDGDDLTEAEAGAAHGASSIWTLLDGVERVRKTN
jgi:pyrroloquinoline-quinone synthase